MTDPCVWERKRSSESESSDISEGGAQWESRSWLEMADFVLPCCWVHTLVPLRPLWAHTPPSLSLSLLKKRGYGGSFWMCTQPAMLGWICPVICWAAVMQLWDVVVQTGEKNKTQTAFQKDAFSTALKWIFIKKNKTKQMYVSVFVTCLCICDSICDNLGDDCANLKNAKNGTVWFLTLLILISLLHEGGERYLCNWAWESHFKFYFQSSK